jgi:hypothetical protein
LTPSSPPIFVTAAPSSLHLSAVCSTVTSSTVAPIFRQSSVHTAAVPVLTAVDTTTRNTPAVTSAGSFTIQSATGLTAAAASTQVIVHDRVRTINTP